MTEMTRRVICVELAAEVQQGSRDITITRQRLCFAERAQPTTLIGLLTGG